MAKQTKAFIRAKEEYRHELKRLRQFKSRAEKRGYEFHDINLQHILDTGRPDTTQELKKAVRVMKELTPEVLYSTAEFLDISTGEMVSGREGRKIERSRASMKGQFARSEGKLLPAEEYVVLDNLIQLLNDFTPSGWDTEFKNARRNTLKSILADAISTNGRNAVARSVQENSSKINRLIEEILYSSETQANQQRIEFDMIEFATIVRGSSLTLDESFDLTQQMEDMELEEI